MSEPTPSITLYKTIEDSYVQHREFSNSPIRQMEHDMLVAESQQTVAEQQATEQAGNFLTEGGKGLVEGGVQMAQDVLDLTHFLTGFFPQPEKARGPESMYQLPKPFAEAPPMEGISDLPRVLTRGLGQFAPMFAPASKLLKVGKAGTALGRVGRGAAAGSLADFGADPNAGNIFNVLSDVTAQIAPEKRVALFEALRTEPDESQLRKRIKNAIAGAPLGIALDSASEAIVFAWKALRNRGTLKAMTDTAKSQAGAIAPPKPAGQVSLGPDWARMAQEIVAEHGKSQGSTSGLKGIVKPTKGYAVSVEPGRSRAIKGDLKPEDVAEWLEKNAEMLESGRYAGTWLEKSTGTHYLDFSEITEDLPTAARLASEHGQKAIYDFGTGESLLRLEHYSDKPGLESLDPRKFGTGQAGRERARAKDPDFVPRTYAYEGGSKPEAIFRGSPYKYETLVPESRMFDISSAEARALFEEAERNFSKFERMIKARGFAGYRDTSSDAQIPGATALFEETPVLYSTARVGGVFQPLIEAGERAKARIDERMRETTLSMGIDPVLMKDMAIYGAALVARGVVGTKAWGERMVSEFGEETIRPHLDAIRHKAEVAYARVLRDGFDQTKATKDALLYYRNGQEGLGWYGKTLPELTKRFGEKRGRIFIGFLAATSPNTTVKSNVTLALKALEQFDLHGKIDAAAMKNALASADLEDEMEEAAFKGFMGSVVGNLERVLAGQELSGPKVKNFHKALLGDPNAVVIDRWMVRTLWPSKVKTYIDRKTGKEIEVIRLTDAQYEFISDWVRGEAAKRGVTPVDLQAAIWVGVKKLKGTRDDDARAFEEIIAEKLAAKKPSQAEPETSFEDFDKMMDEEINRGDVAAR